MVGIWGFRDGDLGEFYLLLLYHSVRNLANVFEDLLVYEFYKTYCLRAYPLHQSFPNNMSK